MISLKSRQEGVDFIGWLRRIKNQRIEALLSQYGELGVRALAAATPVESGATAAAWGFEIEHSGDSWSIHWTNDNFNKGVNIAVILQYGHGTGTGGYVAGRDYINPAIVPIFEQIANDAWKEVTA